MTSYPEDWNTRRREVYQRDSYECQNCGRKGGPRGESELHAHHIVPKSQGGSHQKSNLKTLCKQCHDAAHGRRQAPDASHTETGFVSKLISIFSFSEEYDEGDKDEDGNVRLGKSGESKGFAQRRVDKKLNKKYGGCPSCDANALTKSWIGLKPGEKVKAIECEECDVMYDEQNGELNIVSSPEDIESSSSALKEELFG